MAFHHYHLAQLNVGRMLGPLDSPVMAEFVAQLPLVNAVADRSDGFVWRLTEATEVRPYDDPLILINLSVWQSVETLKAFAYKSGHQTSLRDRTKWFERPQEAHLALWWIPAGHIPSVREAVDRLEFRRTHGDTAVAFSFSKPYPEPEGPCAKPAIPAVNLDKRIFMSGENTPNGDASRDTRFHYYQRGERVWATYDGGRVRFGTLVAVGDDKGRLDMRYQHVDPDGNLRTGTCLAVPELLPDGRICLLEDWHWTNGDLSKGTSVVEEVCS
jgi:hypothetical protein